MEQFLRLRKKLAAAFIERRWLLLAALGASALIFEIVENFDTGDPVNIHFAREVIFFGAIYPLVTLWLLHDLSAVQAERNRLAWQQKNERQLNQVLGQSQNPHDLYQTVISFPESIVPVSGSVLYLPLTEGNEMNVVAERWPGGGERPSQLFPTVNGNFCSTAAHIPGRGLHQLKSHTFMTKAGIKGYCLPLFHQETIAGSLHLYIPAEDEFTADQIAVLNRAAPTMGQALNTRVNENVARVEAAATRKERERIARHLHDTLGSKLAYLQVKVEQLATENSLAGIPAIRDELGDIRDACNEAFEEMRQTMQAIQAESLPELTDAIFNQAAAIAQQGNLELRFKVDGDPQPLPPLAHRKILFIIREALNNVQRHARATIMDLSVAWANEGLVVTLNDNGKGFDPHVEPKQGHFGLLIMAQRAVEIKSDLMVISSPGRGTHVRLHYCLT
jgi:signal transduction histidine kinase